MGLAGVAGNGQESIHGSDRRGYNQLPQAPLKSLGVPSSAATRAS